MYNKVDRKWKALYMYCRKLVSKLNFSFIIDWIYYNDWLFVIDWKNKRFTYSNSIWFYIYRCIYICLYVLATNSEHHPNMWSTSKRCRYTPTTFSPDLEFKTWIKPNVKINPQQLSITFYLSCFPGFIAAETFWKYCIWN